MVVHVKVDEAISLSAICNRCCCLFFLQQYRYSQAVTILLYPLLHNSSLKIAYSIDFLSVVLERSTSLSHSDTGGIGTQECLLVLHLALRKILIVHFAVPWLVGFYCIL